MPGNSALQVGVDTFVWALGSLCQLYRIPFAPNLVVSQVPPPYSLLSLQQAARALGMKSDLREISVPGLANSPLPCLVVLKHPQTASTATPSAATTPSVEGKLHAVDDKAENDSPPLPEAATAATAPDPDPSELPPEAKVSNKVPQHRLALVFRADTERVSFFEQSEKNPTVLPLSEFAERYIGLALLVAAEGKAELADDAFTPKKQEFGFRWFIPELLKHKQIWRDVLLASLAIQLMALATPIFTQIVIDKVIVHHTASTLVVIGVGLFVFMIFSTIMTWVRQYLVLHTGNRIDAVLGLQVFEHLFKLPMRFFEHRPTGVLITRVHGVETIRQFLSGAAVTLCLDIPFLLIFLGVMFYYSWLLTLLVLGMLICIAAVSFFATPVLRSRLNQQFLLGARNQAFLTEYVSGMETVKSLQMEPQLKQRFGEYLASYLNAGFNARQIGNTANAIAGMFDQFQTLVVLCVGAWIVMHSTTMTIGMLVAFQMFANRLSSPLLRMVNMWQDFQQANIAVKRIGDVMNAPAEPYSMVPSRESGGRGKLEIKGLSFRYGENLPYLYRDLEFQIEPGKCVALMGPSGSGKSTLAKLMQGFYLPSDGVIQIDGRDIRHLSANELRSHYGVVPQETILFSGTIYENLTLANPHASFEQVIQACKLSEIHGTIEKLSEGYQTKIGEHGAGLSGGQKQRIAIARALLKRPKILIFDEATSSLDETTSESFAKTVNHLKGKVSMLFIAHRLPKELRIDEMIELSKRKPSLQVAKGHDNTL